jgi:hypothetical protein
MNSLIYTMSQDQFWGVIEKTLAKSSNQKEQRDILVETVCLLDDSELSML